MRFARLFQLAFENASMRSGEAHCGRQVRIPIEADQVFRREAGHRSDLMSATIPK